MIGKLLSTALKTVTLPIDALNITTDIMSGGDGSKASRANSDFPTPFSTLEEIRDALAQAAEDIDED